MSPVACILDMRPLHVFSSSPNSNVDNILPDLDTYLSFVSKIFRTLNHNLFFFKKKGEKPLYTFKCGRPCRGRVSMMYAQFITKGCLEVDRLVHLFYGNHIWARIKFPPLMLSAFVWYSSSVGS